jgi:CHAD domain-containing protein
LTSIPDPDMAYRLKTGAHFQKDVRRLLTAQISRAVAHLSGQNTSAGEDVSAVHETRKALKRCRSILRLVRPGLNKKVFQTEDHAFRSIARILSQERDRQVMAQTLTKLSSQPRPQAEAEALKKASAALLNSPVQGAHHGDPESDARLALTMVEQAAESVRKIRITPPSLDTLAAGFGATYADGRRAFKKAYRSGDDEAFHAFRKLVQHHWRHLNLLSPAWPQLMEVRVASARQLAELLGDDHDLSILAERLGDSSLATLDPGCRAAVIAIARDEQARLRAEAQPIAGRLFAQRPRDMERMIVQLWPAAQRLVKQQRAAKVSRTKVEQGRTVHKKRRRPEKSPRMCLKIRPRAMSCLS